MQPESCPLPLLWNITLLGGIQSLAERWWLPKILTWRNHWNWGWRSPLSSEGWPRTQKKRKKRHPLPNYQWKSFANGWLGKLKHVQDTWLVERVVSGTRGTRLQRDGAWKVQALFCHPKRASEVNKMENYYQASLHHHVSPQKEFPAASWFYLHQLRHPRDAKREDSGICTCALQYWAEKTDLPTGGKPCLLAESVKELQEEMGCYLSFSDKEVFEGVTPPEEMSADPTEKANPHSVATMPAIAPGVQATTKAVEEPAAERRCSKFPSWEKSIASIQTCSGCRADLPSFRKSGVEVS